MLNFAEQTGSGAVMLVWSFPSEGNESIFKYTQKYHIWLPSKLFLLGFVVVMQIHEDSSSQIPHPHRFLHCLLQKYILFLFNILVVSLFSAFETICIFIKQITYTTNCCTELPIRFFVPNSLAHIQDI